MASVQEFNISVPEEQLRDLKQRLTLARLPNELSGAGWELGSPLPDIKRLLNYWRDEYDWRKVETQVNQWPSFTTSIQVPNFPALQIHFVHQKSPLPNAIPLLFLHGWPGSFVEVTKIINLLTRPSNATPPAFDVVAPSLAGYGFSEYPTTKGFGIEQHAETYHALMLRLGYPQYVTQGGDWGHSLTRAMALLHPEACLANHLNMDNGRKPTLLSHPRLYLRHALTPYTEPEKEGHKRSRWFITEGMGYFHEQATKPQTIGYALTDSPIALLAWLYEKLVTWTDRYPWTDEEVCTWVSLYWFSTAGPASSVRLYWEAQHPARDAKVNRSRVTGWIPRVKVGLSHFPKELRVLPSTWTRAQGPVVFERTHDRGGHFAAWEVPELLAADVREMFGRGGGAYGIVPGKSGYAEVGLTKAKL